MWNKINIICVYVYVWVVVLFGICGREEVEVVCDEEGGVEEGLVVNSFRSVDGCLVWIY